MSSVSKTTAEKTSERIPAAQRREMILASASQVFAERGYAGATTDQIAQAAQISQPYVVRMFGTKEKLFIEVHARALDILMTTLRGVIARHSEADPAPEHPLARDLGYAYIDLINDRGILLSLMHSFVLGHDPVIGAAARSGFLDIYRLLRDEAHFSPADASSFMAQGMMFNTLVATGLPTIYDSDDTAAELLDITCGPKLDTLLAASGRGAI
ncbi:MAG: TetR family transcriptional regulator [Glaciihabitans sp.]|nr:TetR family transcriptional regulator [Glaciihabitans sp.]